MQFVTFKDFVPGMVLYPVRDVKTFSQEDLIFREYVVLHHTVEAGTTKIWGKDNAMYFIGCHDPYMGVCASSWGTGPEAVWYVEEDKAILEKVKDYIKADINRTRDQLTEMEQFVDAKL